MLSNLASYLGYQLSPAELEPDVAEAVRLCAVEEDEWLLVERQEAVSEPATTAPCNLPGARPSALQESWYLTPPPSFTSRGPVHMETSPLENLLIEHPSMSVYQKSGKTLRRKTSNSSRSASEEESPLRPPSEDGTPSRHAKLMQAITRNKITTKYSKKTSTKRHPAPSSDEAASMPSASDDECQESKEVKMKNFVKSPRRATTNGKPLRKKSSSQRPDTSSSDEMISIPSNNEDDSPTLGSLVIQTFTPPKKLYSDVLRTVPKAAPVEEVLQAAAPAPLPVAPVDPAPCTSVVESASWEGGFMLVEEPLAVVEKDRRRTAQTVPDQQRQHFLNRSAQKVRIGWNTLSVNLTIFS